MRRMAYMVMGLSFLALVVGIGLYIPSATAEEEGAADALSVITLRVDGMMCNACEDEVNALLKGVDGVSEAKASQPDGIVEVKFDSQKVTAANLVDAINQNTHFKASLPQ